MKFLGPASKSCPPARAVAVRCGASSAPRPARWSTRVRRRGGLARRVWPQRHQRASAPPTAGQGGAGRRGAGESYPQKRRAKVLHKDPRALRRALSRPGLLAVRRGPAAPGHAGPGEWAHSLNTAKIGGPSFNINTPRPGRRRCTQWPCHCPGLTSAVLAGVALQRAGLGWRGPRGPQRFARGHAEAMRRPRHSKHSHEEVRLARRVPGLRRPSQLASYITPSFARSSLLTNRPGQASTGGPWA